ncbi:13071_t:CDS:2, partial [Funneliformis geosporum]
GKSEAIVRYQNLNIDNSEKLIDYTFCEIDQCSKISSNKPCGAETIIHKFQTILEPDSDVINVHKVSRETGHTEGYMLPIFQSCILSKLFNEDKHVQGLIGHEVNGKFGDHGDSDASVYD